MARIRIGVSGLEPAVLLGASLWLLGAAALGCSAGSRAKMGSPGGDGGAASSSSGQGANGEGGLGFGGSGTGGACERHCSADLHQVLDCNELVVTTCPAQQGCAPGGSCVAPCESAQANKSTIGCDFYSVIPGPEYETRGSCFAALLANTWTAPVTITASYGGTTQDGSVVARVPVGSGQGIGYQPLENGKLNPGQIAIVFLAQYSSGDVFWVPCPGGVQSLMNQETMVTGAGLGQAFHITTDRPIVAYDIFPYGGATSFVTSATLLVPTSAWGDNFIAVDAYAANPSLAFVNGYPHVQIVAAQDGTQVTILPTAAIVGGPGVPPSAAQQPVTYPLGRGQMLQIQQPERLIGSPIASVGGPISVWGGTACMNIPIGSVACDSGHQQLMPIKALGNVYLGVQYRSRSGGDETVPYTIVGAVGQTQLVYDPAPPPGAPPTLESGQAVEFSSAGQFSVTSQDGQHPFYLAIHMTGGGDFGGQGDPEYVNVVAPAQWLNKYLFLTDPTYGNTNLVFTRKRAEDSTFKDVKLDCAGVLGGWLPIGGGGQYEYTRVDLVAGGAPQAGCDNGVHTAESLAAFGLTVWGWDTYVSYGYPAGMSVKPINTVVVPPTPN